MSVHQVEIGLVIILGCAIFAWFGGKGGGRA